MFIGAPFIIAKYGSILSVYLIDKWKDKENVIPIYEGILLSHTKNEIMLFATNYHIRDYHTKRSQTDKDKYDVITYMWNQKNGTNEPMYKTEIHSQT